METFDLDSNCYQAPADAEGPTKALCGDDAVTWASTTAGNRTYLCEVHAEMVDRFDDVDVDDHPIVLRCERCRKPTPEGHIDHDRVCDECR